MWSSPPPKPCCCGGGTVGAAFDPVEAEFDLVALLWYGLTGSAAFELFSLPVVGTKSVGGCCCLPCVADCCPCRDAAAGFFPSSCGESSKISTTLPTVGGGTRLPWTKSIMSCLLTRGSLHMTQRARSKRWKKLQACNEIQSELVSCEIKFAVYCVLLSQVQTHLAVPPKRVLAHRRRWEVQQCVGLLQYRTPTSIHSTKGYYSNEQLSSACLCQMCFVAV